MSQTGKFSTEHFWQEMIGLVLMFINGMELNFSLTKVLHNSVTPVLSALPPSSPRGTTFTT